MNSHATNGPSTVPGGSGSPDPLLPFLFDDRTGRKSGRTPRTDSVGRERRRLAMAEFVWLGTELVPVELAGRQLQSTSQDVGSTIYEGIRCYRTERGPALFRLHDHLERFRDRIQHLGFEREGFAPGFVREAIHRTIYANQYEDCFVRLIFYYSGTPDRTWEQSRPQIGVAAWPRIAPPPPVAQSGADYPLLSLDFTSEALPDSDDDSRRGNGPDRETPGYSGLASGSSSSATPLAYLDQSGFVIPAACDDLFLVRHGVLYGPPREAIGAEITRDTLLALARDAGYVVVEEPVGRDQMLAADELFVCTATGGVIPVLEVDQKPIGLGRPGSVTRTMRQLYEEVLHGRSPRSWVWCDYVMSEPLY